MSKKLKNFHFLIKFFKTLLKPMYLEYQLIFPLQLILIDFEKNNQFWEIVGWNQTYKNIHIDSQTTFPCVYMQEIAMHARMARSSSYSQ